MNVRDHMHGRNTSGDLMTFPDIQRVALWQLQPPGMDDSVATKARAAAAAASPARRSHRVPTAAAVVPVRPRCVPCPLDRLRRPATMVGEQTVVTGACHGVISVLCVRLYESSCRF